MKRYLLTLPVLALIFCLYSCREQPDPVIGGAILSDLVKPIEGRSQRATSTRTDENGKPIDANSDNSRVFPGQTKVVLRGKGPGMVTHMWFTFLGPGRHGWAPEGSATHQEMLLRIYYDGHKEPDVEVPFGDFFANCFGRRSEIISLPIVVEDADSYNSFWPMPFRDSIRIEVMNQSKEKNINLLYYNIDWISLKHLPRNTPYFYAYYRQEYPAENGKDYLILETEGKGHYVGTVMAVRTRSPEWFGEGDEKIYIDGETEPSIWGTGTEDYFLSAWSLLADVSTPFFGTVYFDQKGIVGSHTSAFRWHIADPIVFGKSIRVSIEHKGWISPDENRERRSHSWNEREDDISTVAYWYQTGKPTCTVSVPYGEERTLPCLDRIFSAKQAIENENMKGGKAEWQTNLSHFMDGQLTFSPDNEGAEVSLSFNVDVKEPLRLLLSVTRAPDYGIWQAYLNGVKIGRPMNLYAEKVSDWEHHLLDFWPDPGEYVLKLRPAGKDIRSTGKLLGIESVRLRERRPRVKEFAFDRDKDWKTHQVLYD